MLIFGFGVGKPSQALPRQLPQRGSQAVNLDTKVLGTTRKLPGVLLALPLRKDFPRSGGRCRAATKGGIWQNRQVLTERARTLTPSAALSQKAALQMPFAVTTPPVKIAFGALRRARQTRNYKYSFR